MFVMALWRNVTQRDRVEADLDDEMRAVYEMLVDEKVRRGLPRTEARRAAALELGGAEQVKERVRDVRAGAFLESIFQDFRYAGRTFLKNPGFTSVALLMLGLGIGVNTTLFSIVNGMVLRGVPFDRPDRVVYVTTRDSGGPDRGLSYADVQEARGSLASFSGLAAFSTLSVAIGDQRQAPERMQDAYLSADAFRLIGATPRLGRDFRPDDDAPGAPSVVILGDAVWRARYGGESAIIGSTVRINGVPSTVIGVMPDGFRFPITADLWQPLSAIPGIADRARNARTLGVIGRLTDGVALARARAELDTLAVRLAHDQPQTNRNIRLQAVLINEHFNPGGIFNPAWLGFTLTGVLIVLVACANVANLLLSRSVARAREIAIRGSLGATRRRVIRQLLVESALLAMLGGVLGWLFAVVGLRLFASEIPDNTLPYWVGYSMDVRVLSVLVGVCCGCVFLCGLAPALHLSKTRAGAVISERAGAGASRRARRWATLFLALEFAITLFLISGVVLGYEGDRELTKIDRAFDTSDLLTLWITLPPQRYPTPADRMSFYRQLEDRIRSGDAIASVSAATALPIGGGSPRQFVIEGREPLAGQASPTAITIAIGSQYLQTLGLGIVRGRALVDVDGTPGHEGAVVNQRFVDRYFPQSDPIGARMQLRSEGTPEASPWITIVGVSPTVRQRPVPEPDPVIYLATSLVAPPTTAWIVRSKVDRSSIANSIRQQVASLDADLPIYRVMTMDEAIGTTGWNGRLSNMMIRVIAIIALMMAVAGLYTVTANATAQRRQEIGVRISLGAASHQIVWLVLRRAMLELAIGLVAGIGLSFVWTRFLGPMTAGTNVRVTDISVLAPAICIVAVVGIAASLNPARRAMRLNPVAALRGE